jgi:hypothetical protein
MRPAAVWRWVLLPLFGAIPLLVLLGLLFVGRKDLGLKGIVLLIALLLRATWVLSQLPGGSSLLMSFTAVLDIVLVVLKRDIRITG